MKENKKLVVIFGHTCSGKTDLSIRIAEKYNGEIINCDASQFYKSTNIGTAKITKKEEMGITHHLISFLNDNDNYSIFDFKEAAHKCIKDIWSRNKLPILVGGSALYLESVLYNVKWFPKRDVKFDQKYRPFSNLELHNKLKKLDLDEANKLHHNNRKRIIRVLEILEKINISKTSWLEKHRHQLYYENPLLLYLYVDRKIRKEKIVARTKKMIYKGLIPEVEKILKKNNNNDNLTCFKSIGYQETLAYINKQISLMELTEVIVAKTYKFSKKQESFFQKKFNNYITLFPLELEYHEAWNKLLEKYMKK